MSRHARRRSNWRKRQRSVQYSRAKWPASMTTSFRCSVISFTLLLRDHEVSHHRQFGVAGVLRPQGVQNDESAMQKKACQRLSFIPACSRATATPRINTPLSITQVVDRFDGVRSVRLPQTQPLDAEQEHKLGVRHQAVPAETARLLEETE